MLIQRDGGQRRSAAPIGIQRIWGTFKLNMIHFPDSHIDDLLLITCGDFHLRWRFFRYYDGCTGNTVLIAVSGRRFPELTPFYPPGEGLLTADNRVIKPVIQLRADGFILTACDRVFRDVQHHFFHRPWLKAYGR